MTPLRSRGSRGRRTATALAVASIATAGIAIAAANPTASAAKPTAAVAMGDSFISGEGAGDYLQVVDDKGRAQGFNGWKGDNSSAFYCHRSKNAQIEVAPLPGIDKRFNVACSGAHPNDIANPPSSRGAGFSAIRQVKSQIDQLKEIAKTNDIDLVVVNIGSNNSAFDFGTVTVLCISQFIADAYFPFGSSTVMAKFVALFNWVIEEKLNGTWYHKDDSTRTCKQGRSPIPNQEAFDTVQRDSQAAVRAILQTLDEIDEDGQHRVVLQDYINPFPTRFNKNYLKSGRVTERWPRFRELLWKRYGGGCPVHEKSLKAAEFLTTELGSMVEQNAGALRAEFPNTEITYLNVQHAFDGVKLCERWGALTFNLHTPPVTQKWGQGDWRPDIRKAKASDLSQYAKTCREYLQTCQESLHPNAKGHQVLGTCLSEAFQLANTEVTCARNRYTNTIGVTADGSTFPGAPTPTTTTTTTTTPSGPPTTIPKECDPNERVMPTSGLTSKRSRGMLATIGLSQVATRWVEREPVGC